MNRYGEVPWHQKVMASNVGGRSPPPRLMMNDHEITGDFWRMYVLDDRIDDSLITTY